MTAAARQICRCCRGTGYEFSLPEAEIEAIADGLRNACRAAGAKIVGDDRVAEATAAMLVGREPGTLRNWRGLHQPIPFRKLAGRVSYRITDIARWVHENGQSGEI
jgi:hypothetical protein